MAQNILTRNNVRVSGKAEGQPLLFAHGFGCDQNMWRFVAPAFEEQYRVIRFDFVGCGRSDMGTYTAARYESMNGYADDVLEICAALDLREVLYVGHSVSSMIGVLASLREPERFQRLLFVCPSPRYINDADGYIGGFDRADIEGLLAIMEKNDLGWATFLAPIVMKNADQPELTEELEASFCAANPDTARRFAEVTFFSDNRADLPGVRVPSLILQCQDDAIAPLEVGAYLHQHLPQSTLRLMQATGHCPHLSHPVETIQMISEYIH